MSCTITRSAGVRSERLASDFALRTAASTSAATSNTNGSAPANRSGDASGQGARCTEPDSNQWDYENELTVVIGRTCSGITPDQAHDYIFGYSILNDACVRDIPSWSGRYDSPRGKAGDTFAPFGPWVVAKEAVGDPNNLRIRTTVDGELRQDDRTSGLLWPVERIVAFVSRYIKLVPGDIVTTGSTSGNALVTGK